MSYFSWGKLFVSENYTPKKMGIFRKLFLSFTLPQTNSSSLKIGHPKRKRVFQPSNCRLVSISFIFQPSIFTGELTGFASFPPNGSVSKVILGPFMPKTKEKRLDLGDVNEEKLWKQLVGGWTNPFEKYECSQIESSPQVGASIKNDSNHHLEK